MSSVALFGIDLKRPPLHVLDNQKLTADGSVRFVRKPYTREKQFVLPSVGSVAGNFACPMDGQLHLLRRGLRARRATKSPR